MGHPGWGVPFLVRMTGLEPARFWRWNLNPMSLPIPPHPHILITYIIAHWNLNPMSLPVAVPGSCCVWQANLHLADRCHSLSSLYPPPAALASLPNSTIPAYFDNLHYCPLEPTSNESSCCGARLPLRLASKLAPCRPLPLAQLAESAPGGARIAPQFHHTRKSSLFYHGPEEKSTILPPRGRQVVCQLEKCANMLDIRPFGK